VLPLVQNVLGHLGQKFQRIKNQKAADQRHGPAIALFITAAVTNDLLTNPQKAIFKKSGEITHPHSGGDDR